MSFQTESESRVCDLCGVVANNRASAAGWYWYCGEHENDDYRLSTRHSCKFCVAHRSDKRILDLQTWCHIGGEEVLK